MLFRSGNGDVAAMQGFLRPVERWGGRGSRGGAPELIGGARGWPEMVAMANGGDGGVRPGEGESEGEEGRAGGE